MGSYFVCCQLKFRRAKHCTSFTDTPLLSYDIIFISSYLSLWRKCPWCSLCNVTVIHNSPAALEDSLLGSQITFAHWQSLPGSCPCKAWAHRSTRYSSPLSRTQYYWLLTAYSSWHFSPRGNSLSWVNTKIIVHLPGPIKVKQDIPCCFLNPSHSS